MMNRFKSKNIKGFSLIEMLVSIALFAIVVTTSIGTLLVLIDANAKSQSTQAVINNLSFAIDAMARQLRTGVDFRCEGNQSSITNGNLLKTAPFGCNNGGEAIAFTDTRTGVRMGYALEHPGGSTLQRKVGTGPWLDVTGENLIIEELDFVVTGARGVPTNFTQPSVTIYLEGRVGDVNGLGSTFQIQTSVVQRKLDI